MEAQKDANIALVSSNERQKCLILVFIQYGVTKPAVYVVCTVYICTTENYYIETTHDSGGGKEKRCKFSGICEKFTCRHQTLIIAENARTRYNNKIYDMRFVAPTKQHSHISSVAPTICCSCCCCLKPNVVLKCK